MKKGILFIIFLVLLTAFTVHDDGDVISLLRERWSVFNRTYRRVKLDLFFNQPKYSPGDTALVRTWYLTAANQKPVEGRQIVYVDLMDQQGVRVLRNQLMIVNGFASNELVIPKSLSPGIYLLVAYSDWMKNLDPSLFFKQEFIVTGLDVLQKSTTDEKEINITIFPEGGAWITDLENNLLLQLTGELKNGKAVIKSDSGEIALPLWDADGLAEVKMIPRQNTTYYAEVTVNGQLKKFPLPAPRRNGFSIRITTSGEANSLTATLQPSKGMDLKKKYFLILTNARDIIYSRQIEFAHGGPTEYSLPDELPSGIAQVMIVDEDLTRWVQRVVPIGPKSTHSVAIKQATKIYSTREAANIEINVTDRTGNPVQGVFTARITSQTLFDEPSTHTGSGDNLLLYSDISTSFRLKEASDMKRINRYLIGQTCPWLDWDLLLSQNPPAPHYFPKTNLTLSGKASFLDTGKAVPDSTQMMFFLQKQVFGYEIYTDVRGQFNCPILFDFSGTDDVFYSASHRGKDIRGIILHMDEHDTTYGFKSSPWTSLEKEDAYGKYNYRKKIIDKSFSFFAQGKASHDSIANPNAAMEDELQGADITFKTSDYIIFPTMPELIREVLRSVDYRKIRGKDVIRIYTTGRRPTNDAGPLYVIDGILTKNPVTFVNLKPVDVLTIKVIKDSNKLSRFGSLGVNGVILVRTRNWPRKQAVSRENTFTLAGMSPPFVEKPGSMSDPHRQPSMPDLRPCLYWGPHQVLDATGKSIIHFTTSDDVGTFRIQIEGLTKEGTPFSAEETFQVKYYQPQ